MTDPWALSVSDAGAALRSGTLTATDLVQSQLDRIAALNPQIHAFVRIDAPGALAAAAQADADLAAGVDRGPLQGIAVAVKDMIDLTGLPTGCGSYQSSPAPAAEDAQVVAALRARGAVIMGKVATYEYALNGPTFDAPHPPVLNPWNRAHITGGSSSGSAAAVAAGMVRLAIGTDTGGSVRSPACYCGIVGLKPTFGALSCARVVPLAPTLDHVGPMGTTVADTAALAAGMGLTGAAARIGLPVAGMKIGYARDWFAGDPATHPGVLQAMDRAMSDLSLMGIHVSLIPLPGYADAESLGITLLQHEAYAQHRTTLPGAYGAAARAALLAGAGITQGAYDRARAAARALRAQMADILSRHDAVVTANVLAPAPPLADFAAGAVWTAMRTLPFNATGHPALALPIGLTDGLPVGLQLVGRDHHEPILFQIGHAFEKATDHTVIRPPV